MKLGRSHMDPDKQVLLRGNDPCSRHAQSLRDRYWSWYAAAAKWFQRKNS